MGQVPTKRFLAGYGDTKKDAIFNLQRNLKFEYGAVVCQDTDHMIPFHVHTSAGLVAVRFEQNGFNVWKAFIEY